MRTRGQSKYPVVVDRAGAPDLARVWIVGARAKPREIESELSRFSASERLRDPLALALRGLSAIVSGDARGGSAVLRRAFERSEGAARIALADLLAPQLISQGALDEALHVLDIAGEPHGDFRPAHAALRAIIAAQRGEDRRSAALAESALEPARTADEPLITARSVQRIGLAAFYRDDFVEAEERSLEAARAFERADALGPATTAYTVLYAIAYGHLNDAMMARIYAERIATLAQRDGNHQMHVHGLVAQIELAAESGDERRLGSVRGRLLAMPHSEQFRERFSYVLATAIDHIWNRRFDSARAMLSRELERDQPVPADHLLAEALLSLLDAARWDIESTRRRSQRVINRTAQHPPHEPLYERHRRRVARVLAASAGLLTGDIARSRRALGSEYDPDGVFVATTLEGGADVQRFPLLLRGFARILNIVAEAASAAQPQAHLTATELKILRALPSSASVNDMAHHFHNSPRTIERHLTNIYAKLQAKNRIEAIRRARSLGIE